MADLMRRGLSSGVAEGARPPYRVDPDTGLPTVRSRRMITAEDVREMDDEA